MLLNGRAFEAVTSTLNEYVTEARKPLLIMHPGLTSDKECREHQNVKDTQRQFSENTCSEDDLRSRIFGTIVVKFLACLPASPRIFELLKKGIIAHLSRIFTLKRSPRIFGSLFFWLKFSES